MEGTPPSSGRFKPVKLTASQKRKLKKQYEEADRIREETKKMEEQEIAQIEQVYDDILDDIYS